MSREKREHSLAFRKILIQKLPECVTVNDVSTAQYELLKCSNCGKTLGYIFIDVKIFPPKSWTRLVAGGPIVKTEKDVLCTECYKRLQ